MRKDRLAQFKKRLLEKHRQVADEVGRTAIYGKDQEDDSIKDLGDQANTAYTREFFFELGNGNHRLLRDVVLPLNGQQSREIFPAKPGDRDEVALSVR